jgi:hypothetical protein
MSGILIVIAVFLAFALLAVGVKWIQLRRVEFIRNSRLPPGLYDKLREKHPQLSLKDCQLVGHALRQFFLAYLKSEKQEIAMPSQVVDDLWHEFILYTRHYSEFCRRAFGGFLHHTPAAALGKSPTKNDGLRRCWWQACREEDIHPQKPTRLPLLFALDRKLGIKGGFVYLIDCRNPVEAGKLADAGLPIHCAADLKPLRKDRDGSGSSCGGSSCSGSSSHGCSGGSCSGGCGGGGD